MTEEEKLAVLWDIAQKVANTDTTHETEIGPVECIFCNGDYNYKNDIYNHALGCIVIRARALIELKGSNYVSINRSWARPWETPPRSSRSSREKA